MRKPLDFNVQLDSENAKLPERQNEGDAGYDLYATDIEFIEDKGIYMYDTGVHVQIPEGHVGMIAPRSSVYKKGLMLANNMGVIDRGYRGEIKVLFVPIHRSRETIPEEKGGRANGAGVEGRQRQEIGHTPYQIGERIAQLLLVSVSTPQPTEVSSLSASERGAGGLGSTGNTQRNMSSPKFEKGEMVQIKKDSTMKHSGRRVKVLEVNTEGELNTYRFREIFGYYPESHLQEPGPTIMEEQYGE